MKTRLLALAFAVMATGARADCWGGSPLNFAVQFKLHDILGWPEVYEDMSLAQLGQAHWRVRKIMEWAATLQPGCIREDYQGYLGIYMESIEDNANRLKSSHRTNADPHEANDQAIGHLLSGHIPAPRFGQ